MSESVLLPSALFHVGFVVADFNGAMDELSRTLGVSWRELLEGTSESVSPDGRSEILGFTAVYTQDGPVHYELLQKKPGTIWDVPDPGAIHHVGYWSEDVEADAQRLDAAGMTRAGTYRRDGRTLATYHRPGCGPLVELVWTGSRERIVGPSG